MVRLTYVASPVLGSRMPREGSNQPRIVIQLPPDLHAAAVECSRADERALAATVRLLLRRYVAECQDAQKPPGQ